MTSQNHCVLPSRQRSPAVETSPSYLATGGEESSAATLYTAEQQITWTRPKKHSGLSELQLCFLGRRLTK